MFICVTIIRYVESHAFTAQYHINYYRSTNKRCYGPERQQPALAGQLADYIAKKCYGSTGKSTKQKRCVAGKPHFTHSQKPIREQHNHSNAKPCTFFSLLFFVKSSETKRDFHQKLLTTACTFCIFALRQIYSGTRCEKYSSKLDISRSFLPIFAS